MYIHGESAEEAALANSYLEFPQREFPRSGIAGIPIGIPASKTALSWEFLGIPIQRGYVHTEEVLLHTEGGFGGVSYQYITKFLIHRALVAHLPWGL